MRRAEARAKRAAETKKGRCPPLYIVAEGTQRLYGGPEEGGWYYSSTTPLEVCRAWDWRQALAMARQLKEDWPTCPRGSSSVLGGTDVEIRLYRYPESIPEPTRRPYYE